MEESIHVSFTKVLDLEESLLALKLTKEDNDEKHQKEVSGEEASTSETSSFGEGASTFGNLTQEPVKDGNKSQVSRRAHHRRTWYSIRTRSSGRGVAEHNFDIRNRAQRD